MKHYCPVCGSDEIFVSQSLNSFFTVITLHKNLRCHRCCEVFAVPLWRKVAHFQQTIKDDEDEDKPRIPSKKSTERIPVQH